MKIGIDMHHGFLTEELPVEQALEKAKQEGYEGVYYKSALYVSGTLDQAELQAAYQCASDLGLYIDLGIGRVNPFNTNETPEVWMLGGGNYLLAMEKLIRASASIGATELIGVTAGWKGMFDGYHVYDRYRTDVTWEEQLEATSRFLRRLAPSLREYGVRINLETHEEITTFEILRLIEEVGEDVLGVALDTANVVARGEDPVNAAKRVSPYVHQMHAKDCIVTFSDTGLVRQIRPAGEGIVDFAAVCKEIAVHSPELHMQIEDHKGLMHCDFFVDAWRQSHPDLQMADVTELFRHAKRCEQRIASGELMDPALYERFSYQEQRNQRLAASKSHLFSVVRQLVP
ncbi:sugar phosphate isomerase/epimerase [Paenibacillus sp. H1-7]|uniref:sugar phosphate isomerase/epimerase family protein n=1 Tax=Paenibacillus sp. H1-7 TaxID=2282849 RepID=UPI001EF7F887|nr:sugar phosphate isomerase/epimerase family protein [Paenibacillus sp. H1-7]ULL14978.1 sugar phosphate isomerase/epimerase [Paenibacillus sp. H1-7]